MMDTTVTFNSVEEECCHWKAQARKYYQEYLDVKEELDDYTDSSQQLEAELEAQLEQKEKTVRDLKMTNHQLQSENESLYKRLNNFQADYSQLEKKCNTVTDERDHLKTYTRELEQINDDLERAQRVVTESVAGFEGMLNQAYEKNALLEMEVDEKEVLQVKLQRLMDETRDLKQELNIRTVPSADTGAPITSRSVSLSNDVPATIPTITNSTATATVTDSGRQHVESETQTTIGGIHATLLQPQPSQIPQPTTQHPLKHSENVLNGNAMTASSRLSALNLVAELLRKVNLDKLLCADCEKFRCVCVQPELVRPSTLPPLRTAPGSTLLKRLSQKISAATSTNSTPAFDTSIEDSATSFKAMAIGRDSSETAITVSSPNVSNICYTRRISLDEQPLRHHPAIARSIEPTSMPTKPTQL